MIYRLRNLPPPLFFYLYITEEKLLIATYWDSTIRIYDEEDAEESQLLKVLSGGHKESEISGLQGIPRP